MPAASPAEHRRRSARTTVAAAALVAILMPAAASGSAPFERVDRTEENISQQLFAGVITPDGSRALFSSTQSNQPIVEVDLDTMEPGRVISPSANLGFQAAVIDPAGEFAYFGTAGLTVPRIKRISLIDGTVADGSSDFATTFLFGAAVIDPDGRYAYFAENGSPHRVIRYELFGAGVADVDGTPLEGTDLGGTFFSSGVIDPDGRYAYFGTGSTGSNPGRVVRIEVRDSDGDPVFRAAGHIELEGTEQRLLSAVIDPSGDYAYFGTSPATVDTSRIVVKVDLRTFRRVGAIPVGGSGRLEAAVIDPAGEFAYFATTESPARIHRVRLAGATCDTGVTCAGMEVVSTISLNSGENDVRSAVIAPDGRFAYFGLNRNPGRVVRVRIADDPPPLIPSEPASGPVPPSVSCGPGVVSVGATVACTVTGGDAGIDILWRAAYNPVIAEAGVTLDDAGSGEFSFVVPASSLGEELTVELVEWTAPMSLGVVAPPVPSGVPAGEGTPAQPLWALLMAFGVALALARRPLRSRT